MFWQSSYTSSSTSSLQLSRKLIYEALKEIHNDHNNSEFMLHCELMNFIYDRIFPILNRDVKDSPEYLEKLLKAIINTLYLEKRYPNNEDKLLTFENENRSFNQAIEAFNKSPNKGDEAFEQCLLATVPVDGRVFILNERHLKPLQDLAKRCGIKLNPALKVEVFEVDVSSSRLYKKK